MSDLNSMVPEHIELNPSSAAEYLAIVAIADMGVSEVPNLPQGGLDVLFVVNGVQLPFAKTAAEIFRRYEEEIDRQVVKKFEERARDIIEPLEQSVRDATAALRCRMGLSAEEED